ncbi:MAG: hypothetical protein ACD_60C00164G0001, partial [uncultured bacterium]
GVLKVITGLSHNDFSKERIQKTLNELREERDMM